MKISKLWLVAVLCLTLAFIVSHIVQTTGQELPKVGRIKVERYGQIMDVDFYIDQLQFDSEKNQWFVRADNGYRFYTFTD